MKYKKSMLASTFILSAALLSGCVSAKEEASEKEETPIIQKEVTEKEPSVVEYKTKNTLEGFKVVGNVVNGYIKIPEKFTPYRDVNNPNSPVTQFANKDHSFIISYSAIDEDLSFEYAVQSLKESVIGGPELQETESKYAGLQGVELLQDFSDFGEEGYEDFKVYIYVLKGETADRYIAIEYYGDKKELKDKILESYSEINLVK